MTTNEMTQVRELAGEFLRRELLPQVKEFDEREEFPVKIYREFVKLGLATINFPESFGGVGSCEALSIVAEEMARVDPGFALSVLASSQLFGYNVMRSGSEEQKKKYLTPLVKEGKLGCWALTEPDTGSDAVGIKTKVVREKDHYILNGSKTFITNAPIADFFIVIARESGTGIEGGTSIILDKKQEGLEVSRPLKKMGNRTSPTGQLFFHNCRVPVSQVLGQPGKAFIDMKHSLDMERAVFGAIPLGIMKECCEISIDYALERKQFGVAISEFQLVQAMIADMVTKTELAEKYAQSLWCESGEKLNFMAAVYKYVVAESVEEVTRLAIQILGGNGYMREYLVEKMYRDGRLFAIGGGTSEINKLIISKQALKRRKQKQ